MVSHRWTGAQGAIGITASRRSLLAAAGGLGGMALLQGCTSQDPEGSTARGLKIFDPDEREALPRISGALLDGGEMDSAKLLGSVVVYNLWGSWCGPCRDEAPILRRVEKATRDNGVQFMGVNVRDNKASALAFERRYRIEYPSIDTEESGEALRSLSRVVPVQAVPSTVVVDARGDVASRVVGVVTESMLTGLIEDALDQSPI